MTLPTLADAAPQVRRGSIRALLGDRSVARGRRGVELTCEAAAAELAGDVLDEVVDHFLGRVGHLSREIVDLGLEVVEEPHCWNCDEQTESRRDECLGDTARDR